MRGYLKIFLYLAIGEVLAAVAALPVPGSIIGLMLMLTDFASQHEADAEVERIFDGVAPHLTLLFIPAGAGVIAYSGILGDAWWIILISITAGTLVTMIVTATAFRSLATSEFDFWGLGQLLKRMATRRDLL